MRNVRVMACLVLAILASAFAPASGAVTGGSLDPSVTVTSPTTINAGDSVTVTIANAPGVSPYEWVGFYPIANGITGYVYEKYLNNSLSAPSSPLTGGTVTFTTVANLLPGQYEVRLNSPDPTTVAESETITVLPPISITVSSTTAPAGSAVTATVAHSPGASRFDWVGFYPAANTQPSGYLYEKYLNDATTPPESPMTGGTVTFVLPSSLTPGAYNIRFNNTVPTTLATSATISVTPPPTVTVPRTTTAPGAIVTATIANGPATSRWDWVGFYPVGNAITGYLYEKYLNDSTTAPTSPMAGGTITFALPPNVPEGQYNVRLNTAAGTTVATSVTVTVAPTIMALSATAVARGGTITATIHNAPAASRYEWLALYPVANSITGYLAERYLNDSTSPPDLPLIDGQVTFTIPANAPAGQYDIRFNDALPTAIVRSAPFVVAPQADTPTITPGSGTYATAQTVSLSVQSGVEVRYTTDGIDPSASSTLYAGAFPVTTGTTVKARAFATGWDPSAVASATLSFDYGPLPVPTALPAGGVYSGSVHVTLSSIPGATIRYTVDGTEPTISSAVYTSPVAVSSGSVTLNARAFHPDWTQSGAGTQTYTIDVTPPTIVAERFPLPMGGWHLTPVTVSFVCSDSVGIAACSGPATVSTEGAGQTVSGTAIDDAGLEATVQETVNIDLTPPVVTLTAPLDGLVTADSSVAVSAEVSDALSGVGVVNCNGVVTPVVNGVVTCSATLRPGRNAITVSARDLAGHSRSAGATITLAGTPSHLTLSPAARTMLVGETATLSLRDNFGVPAPAATWISTNPSVVSLSADDPPVLTALASGTATIQVLKNGLSAISTLTVVEGPSLPDGTTRWNVAPTPGSGWSWLEGPMYTNRVDEDGPDLFMVETNTTTWERRLRAVSSSSGEVAWLASVTGVPLMGDMFGGVIAGIEPSNNYCLGPANEIQRCYIGLSRVAASASTAAWRYDSLGLVDRPAQGPDGTIYVVEHLGDYLYAPNSNGNAYFPFPGEKALVILDGATGEITARVPLEGDPNREPVTVGPIVGSDGFGHLLVTKGMEITLRTFSRDGQVASTVIVPATCTGTQCRQPVPSQLLPDGLDGLLITADWGNAAYLTIDLRLTRIDSDGVRTDTQLTSNSGRIEMIGLGGTAYLRQTSGATTIDQPVMDVATWTPRWSLPVEWSLLAAKPDGGAVAQNAAGDQGHFDGTGQLLGIIPASGLRNPVHGFGGWTGVSGVAPNTPAGLRKVEGTIEDATYFDVTYAPKLWTGVEQNGFGNRANQSAPPTVPRISVRCRPVDGTFPISFFDHCYIVVRNRDGSLQTIQGFEQNFQPIGTLVASVIDGDEISPNKSTDPTLYVSDDADADFISCLKTNTTVMNGMHLDYHFLGPNSNRFVVEVMGSCGRTVKLYWRAIGANVPFNLPQ